jgi:predicted phosphodiesterase
LRQRKVLFSFAVISDTNNEENCALGQGQWLKPALKIFDRRKPDFVVGLGDLVAGGGDCREADGDEHKANLEEQLQEFKKEFLDKLNVPFVPVAGNHDLDTENSTNERYPWRIWKRFWEENAPHLLKAAAPRIKSRYFRFTHQDVGFVALGYKFYGLGRDELYWARKNIKPGDVVFRHINLHGISCAEPDDCGFAIRSFGVSRYERLVEVFKKQKVKALFAAHTHAFYDGVCDGLRFVNTGSLSDRGMEYLIGWKRSRYKNRQAFVWVDVMKDRSLRVNFYVYNRRCRCFRIFSKRQFPRKIKAKRVDRGGHDEGVKATCVSIRRTRGTGRARIPANRLTSKRGLSGRVDFHLDRPWMNLQP